MKKVMLLCFALIALFSPKNAAVEENSSLEVIAETAMEEQLEIESWQVIFVEKISKTQFDKFSNELKTRYKVTIENDKSTLKYTFVNKEQNALMKHSFHAVVPKNTEEITVQLVVTGNKWNDHIKSHYKQLTAHLQSNELIQFSRSFTCLKLKDNVIIENRSYYEDFLKKFNLENVKIQYDNVQNSTYFAEFYGHSTLWNEEISVNDEKINFQMMVKQTKDQKTQLIIGTPIVLHEY